MARKRTPRCGPHCTPVRRRSRFNEPSQKPEKCCQCKDCHGK